MVTRVSEALIERVRDALKDGTPRTHREVAKIIGVTVEAALRATTTLYERRQIHAADFQRCARNGNLTPVYAIGNEPDAEIPERQAQRSASHEYLIRERAWLRESRASGGAPFRSLLDVALFGDAPPVSGQTKWTGRIVRQSMSVNDEEVAA